MKTLSLSEIPPGTPIAGLTWGQFQSALVGAMNAVHRQTRQELENDAAAWTASEIAKQTRRRPQTVLAALRSGALPGHRVGNRWCASVANVRVWVERGCPVAALGKAG